MTQHQKIILCLVARTFQTDFTVASLVYHCTSRLYCGVTGISLYKQTSLWRHWYITVQADFTVASLVYHCTSRLHCGVTGISLYKQTSLWRHWYITVQADFTVASLVYHCTSTLYWYIPVLGSELVARQTISSIL